MRSPLLHKACFLICACLGLLFYLAPAAKATHLRSGNLFVKSDTAATPNPLKYYFKLVTYSVAPSPPAFEDPEAKLYFGDCTSQTVLRASRHEIYGSDSNSNLDYGNGIIRSYVNVYYFEHTYAGPGNYTATFSAESRYHNLINISNSLQQTFELQATLVIDPLIGKNRSPVFSTHPVYYGNLNQPYYHTLGAYDADGDSLVYKLVTPKTTGGQTACGDPIQQNAPGFLSLDNFLGNSNGTSLRQASLDPETGLFTWNTPPRTGNYTLVILVEEWRNGRLIGTVTRDMLIDIKDNALIIPPNAGEDQKTAVSTPVTLGQTANPGFEYHWEPSFGLSDPALANPTVTLSSPQKVAYVLVTLEKATGKTAMDAVNVTVMNAASTPTITLIKGDTLLAGPATWTYQWRKDGVIIPNQTLNKLKAVEAGTYSVRIETSQGIFSPWSPDFKFSSTVTGISDELRQAIHLYPNPATTTLLVQIPAMLRLQSATVYNKIGQEKARLTPVRTNQGWAFDVASLPPGWYLFNMNTDKGTLVHKLLITR